MLPSGDQQEQKERALRHGIRAKVSTSTEWSEECGGVIRMDDREGMGGGGVAVRGKENKE